MRTPLILLILLLAAQAIGQSSQQRIEAIWNAAGNRMIVQQDAWFEDGDYPACISLLETQSQLFPSDYEIWTNLGWMQENVHEWDAALRTYQEYRRRNPQDPDGSLPEAMFLFQKKQYAKLPDILEPVIKHKCHPNNFRLLAWTYEKTKQLSDAVRVWKSYLQMDPKDLAAQKNLARDEKKLAAQSSR